MPINMFKVKKYVAFLTLSAIPLMAFFFTLIEAGNLLYSAFAWLIATMLMMFFSARIISNPMLRMVEGDGILGITIDSTGVVEPFILRVIPPFVKAKLRGKEIEDVWDRDATFYIKHPKEGQLTVAQDPDGNLYEVAVLGRVGEDHNEKLFAFEGHLLMIFNKALNCFLTKQSLANLENKSLIKHAVFYLNEKTEELTMQLRDFARYIIEQTKPKRFFGMGNWFIVIVIVAVLLLILLFLPAFMDVFSNAGGIIPVQPVQPVSQR